MLPGKRCEAADKELREQTTIEYVAADDRLQSDRRREESSERRLCSLNSRYERWLRLLVAWCGTNVHLIDMHLRCLSYVSALLTFNTCFQSVTFVFNLICVNMWHSLARLMLSFTLCKLLFLAICFLERIQVQESRTKVGYDLPMWHLWGLSYLPKHFRKIPKWFRKIHKITEKP